MLIDRNSSRGPDSIVNTPESGMRHEAAFQDTLGIITGDHKPRLSSISRSGLIFFLGKRGELFYWPSSPNAATVEPVPQYTLPLTTSGVMK